MAKKVTKKTAKKEKIETKASNITTNLIVAVLIFVGGFVIGCACSARSVYNNTVTEKDAVNAVEPAEK